MNDSKLIQILKTLTEREWEEFEKFSSSVYFNKGRNYLPLIKALKKFYPEFTSETFSKEYVYKKMFPSKKFNESVIKVMFSGLTSLAEKFLAQTEFEKNYNEHNRFLNDSLIERKLYSLFDSNYKSSTKKLNEESLRNNYYRFFKYYFEQQRYRKLTHQQKSIFSDDDDFKQLDTDLKYYILHELSRFYQPALNQNYNFENKKYKLFDFLIEEIEKEFKSCPRTLHCYYFYFKLILTNEGQYFKKLYSCVKDQEGAFVKSELRNFYVTLANYVGVSVNHDPGYTKEYFEITNILSEKDFLIQDNGYIDPKSLTNIVNLASQKEYHNIARGLVEKNYSGLRPEIMESTYNYCIGVIELHQKNYETALEYFSKVQPYDFSLKLNTDVYRLAIFYELKHFENALSLSDSFIRFVKNHEEMNQDLKNRYDDFVKHYKKLLNVNFDNYNDAELSLLRIETESKKDLMLKKWFLKKLDEMKQLGS